MFVEIAGLPGCGKTTLYTGLARKLASLGIANTNINDISMHRQATDWIPRFVRRRPERELLFRFSRFLSEHAGLVSYAERVYDHDDVRQFLFTLMCANYQAARDLTSEGEVVFLEEGFVTHSVAACYGLAQEHRTLNRMVSKLPVVDLLVYIDTPADVAYERIFDRRGLRIGDEKLVAKFGEVDAFHTKAKLFRRGVDQYRDQGAAVVEIPAGWDVDSAVETVVDRLLTLKNGPALQASAG